MNYPNFLKTNKNARSRLHSFRTSPIHEPAYLKLDQIYTSKQIEIRRTTPPPPHREKRESKDDKAEAHSRPTF